MADIKFLIAYGYSMRAKETIFLFFLNYITLQLSLDLNSFIETQAYRQTCLSLFRQMNGQQSRHYHSEDTLKSLSTEYGKLWSVTNLQIAFDSDLNQKRKNTTAPKPCRWATNTLRASSQELSRARLGPMDRLSPPWQR